jgi:polyphosphate glucokinase
MIEIVRTLLNYDALHIGGGNAAKVDESKLPDNVKIASNDMGIIGGLRLWDDVVWKSARDIGHGDEDG